LGLQLNTGGYIMADNMDYNQGIDTTSLLLARGFGGYGGGYGNGLSGGSGGYGGGYLASESLANGTATKTAIDAHAIAQNAGIENLLDQNQFAATNKNIVDGHARISDTAAVNVNRVADNQFRSELRFSDQISGAEFRSLDRQRDIERMITGNAKDAAACCCEAKLLACKDHSELKALIISENSMTRAMITTTALDAANAKITQLETINALSHHGRP
jgi:hypothetical protein